MNERASVPNKTSAAGGESGLSAGLGGIDGGITVQMLGVREYAEGMMVELDISDTDSQQAGRLVIRAKNECGHNCTEVDLLDLLNWIQANRQDLLPSNARGEAPPKAVASSES
jgi:hypothetical protein